MAGAVVGKVAKQPVANAYEAGEVPLATARRLQWLLLATEVRRPWHRDMGWQNAFLFRQLHERFHKVVQ